MIRSTELEVHALAQKLFEQENPKRFWRLSTNLQSAKLAPDRTANMMERQTYLARARDQMRRDGVFLEVEEYPAQPGARR